MTPKVEVTKEKIDKWDYIKFKMSAQQETMSKKESIEWKEMLANAISVKG